MENKHFSVYLIMKEMLNAIQITMKFNLMRHTVKLLERVIKWCLRLELNIPSSQLVFILEWSTINTYLDDLV